MTTKQKLLQLFYPVLMLIAKAINNKSVIVAESKQVPLESFYNLQSTLNNGTNYDFSLLKGKKVLIVNTASDCGYTAQYDALQRLYQQFSGELIVLAFPSNDFNEQEKANDESIAKFCKMNFGVTFPIMKKGIVIKVKEQQKVYQWLTDASKNGWNNQAPTWNFCKYLIDENGYLIGFFASPIDPLSKEIVERLR